MMDRVESKPEVNHQKYMNERSEEKNKGRKKKKKKQFVKKGKQI